MIPFHSLYALCASSQEARKKLWNQEIPGPPRSHQTSPATGTRSGSGGRNGGVVILEEAMQAQRSKFRILIVEDSDVDHETTLRAFNHSKMPGDFFRCVDGEEALNYLFRRGDFSNPEDAPEPDLILLDLNLPGTHGLEVIEEIKSDPDRRRIPVIVLSTSTQSSDIESCYRAGANAYMVKPVDLLDFNSAVEKLKEFWFQAALLPQENPLR